jgi:hypothetical protein
METAIFTLMLGALGLGIALGDLGDQQQGLQVAHRVFQAIEDGVKYSLFPFQPLYLFSHYFLFFAFLNHFPSIFRKLFDWL